MSDFHLQVHRWSRAGVGRYIDGDRQHSLYSVTRCRSYRRQQRTSTAKSKCKNVMIYTHIIYVILYDVKLLKVIT